MTEYPITRQRVPDVLIASIQFPASERDRVPDRFDQLRAAVAAHITGPRMVLYHHDAPEMEVVFPVAQPVNAGDVRSRVLPGGEMICTTHTGPHTELTAAWGAIRAYLQTHALGLSNHSSRVIYHAEEGDQAAFVTEIQRPLMLPVWLERMASGLERVADHEAREYVLSGSEGLINGHTPLERAEWAIGAMERLDEIVDDADARTAIMMECTHRFPEITLEHYRAEFERLNHDIRALIPIVHPDEQFHAPDLRDNVLTVSKVPADRAAYEAAESDIERRVAYCHCPLIHAAIRAEKPVSRTYCACGAGWFEQIWGGILGQPVKVEVEESILVGDARCRFAVHLPPDAVEG